MARPDFRAPANVAQAMEEAAALYRQGRIDDAEKICARIVKARPDWFDALHLLGLIRLQTGKAGAGLGLLEAALKLEPRSSPAMTSLGMAYATLNRDADALAAFEKALALAPDNFEAFNNRGNVLLKLNRAAEALADFERAAALEPRFLGALLNRGSALAQLGRLDDALAQFDAVLAAQPAHAPTHCNRGLALAGLGRHADAIAAYDRALALAPDYVKAHIARGASLQALNRHTEAVASFDGALKLDKDNADARHNAALSFLTLGDYRRGFDAYEARWRRTGMPLARRFGKPLWLGEYPLQRRTILIHAEQGLGDTIQFVRYAPILARGGAKVVLEAPPELAALLARVAGVAAVVKRGDTLPAFVVHCPAGSLPRALRTEAASIPANVPYLKASEERIAKWRPRLEALPSPRVAIAWSGRATHANDRNRSIALAHLAPLLTAGQGSFIGIQRDLREGDAELLSRTPHVTHLGDALEDFDDTAAVVTLADLVIAVDTSVVHLAGALGRPVWVLLPFQPDWRWMLDREDSPWYPTARLCRQPAPGDWESVIARVKEELSTFVVKA